jgi:DNA-binding phage protein
MDITDIPLRVRKALKDNETPGGLAKKAGLHRNTLYGCERPNWNPSYETLIALASVLADEQDAAA